MVLAHASHIVVRLYPHAVVARVPVHRHGERSEAVRRRLTRELSVARHLLARGVATVEPADGAGAGPWHARGEWLSLWRYHAPGPDAPDAPDVVAAVLQLAAALADYPGWLPRLGAWRHVAPARAWLGAAGRPETASLAVWLDEADARVAQAARRGLVPAHGDAHRGNLVRGTDVWRWSDFEDASRMPPGWDLASAVANDALLHGLGTPAVEAAFAHADRAGGTARLATLIWDRSVMATATNLHQAAAREGDAVWARRQLRALPRLARALGVPASAPRRERPS